MTDIFILYRTSETSLEVESIYNSFENASDAIIKKVEKLERYPWGVRYFITKNTLNETGKYEPVKDSDCFYCMVTKQIVNKKEREEHIKRRFAIQHNMDISNVDLEQIATDEKYWIRYRDNKTEKYYLYYVIEDMFFEHYTEHRKYTWEKKFGIPFDESKIKSDHITHTVYEHDSIIYRYLKTKGGEWREKK